MSRLNDTKGFTFQLTKMCGFDAYLHIYKHGERIGQFFFNTRGFVADFRLTNDKNVGWGFGEKGQSTQIRELKQAIRQGFCNFEANN